MVKIINMGGNPLGICKYDVMINNDLIAQFEHDRTHGLGQCLIAAAKACEKAKFEELAKQLVDIDEGDLF